MFSKLLIFRFSVFIFLVWLVVSGFCPTGQKPSLQDSIIHYSRSERYVPRLLFDYYHHQGPNTKVGNYLVTGNWVDNGGRYGWDDFVHTNTFDPLFVALESDYAIAMLQTPYNRALLDSTEAVVLVSPDNPRIVPSTHVLSDEELRMLIDYVHQGGSLMIIINSGGDDRVHEEFEQVQLRKLANTFGLDWNNDDTHYSDNQIKAGHPYFYDVPVFHYGAGCTLKILPEAEHPETLLEVYSDAGYPDRAVRGPGIVMVRPGKGKVLLVGDTGSWTGNMARPWADNEKILKQLFRYLKPDRGVRSAQLDDNQSLTYSVTVAGLQAIPVQNSLLHIQRPLYQVFSPREKTDMPFIEANAKLRISAKPQQNSEVMRMQAAIEHFRWFDDSSSFTGNESITYTASKQGKVSGVEADGDHALWLAPDISLLNALLPVDGLRVGDHWESLESLRIPSLRATDIPPVKTLEMRITYVSDTLVEGRPCRLLRASGEIWLNDLGVGIEDLLPLEESRRVGGLRYAFYHERGGKLLFKREQWVDARDGTVIKARMQSRILTWVHDKRKTIKENNADRDTEMLASLAHVITFDLDDVSLEANETKKGEIKHE
ncbi:hypothetical protein H8S90_08275 [Olivibacter sp. SDN3]|uniref:hypothetical protein n=1 Tax=Olivibacter sp. SDN3 TaxID=2764720 RepID=UPI0016511FF6|nr:hypothetical protein [Olivibacter sp. SDN3]QNL51553.1 hypothetical protein H8S90_08275 [Olivibacter sp. SDN3]